MPSPIVRVSAESALDERWRQSVVCGPFGRVGVASICGHPDGPGTEAALPCGHPE
jgi:hypothetical protein